MLIGVVLAAGAGTAAVAPDGAAAQTNRIYVCAGKSGRALTIATATRRCPNGQRKLSWEIRGLRGEAGPAGANGPAGPAGAIGPRGPQGPADGPAGGALAGTFPNPSLAAGAVTAGALADGAVTTAKLGDGAVTGAKVGLPLTITSPLAEPMIALASGAGPGLEAMLTAKRTDTGSTGAAIRGETTSVYSNVETAGVVGVTSGQGGFGVFGRATSASGNGPGVIGDADGTGNGVVGVASNGSGVEGTTNSVSATRAGVSGLSPSFASGGNGVRGVADGAGSTGVRATATGAAGYGLRATASGVGGIGLEAVAGSGGSARAAILRGNVDVIGTLTKSSGTFKIDNPENPREEYLSHSFVESPDMKNLYDGVVTTDAEGFATVTMPSWFQPLNRDFRYQLTVLGRSFAEAVVWDELEGGRSFRIRTDAPRVKVSWQVTGTRHDAYANAHRTPTVEPKTGADRGRYLNPEVYGAPASEGIGR